MKEATARCLRDGFGSDSMAHVRYLLYAQKAEEERFPAIARLFRAAALSRYARAAELYRLANAMIGTRAVCADTYFTFDRTMDNLERARNEERRDADELVPAAVAVAESQGEGGAVRSLKRSAAIYRQWAAILDRVFLETRHAAEEPPIGDVYICKTCGMAIENVPGDDCPVCGADKGEFVIVI